MGDMRGAFNKAGFPERQGDAKCANCGKPFQRRDPKHKYCSECVGKVPKHEGPGRPAEGSFFKEGYPDYFDNGVLRPEFVTDLAEEIAQRLGGERPPMTMHQLRAFYGQVKRLEGAMKRKRPFREVNLEIQKLKPIASERASKDKVPKYFEQFIIRNVDKVKDEESFLKGFVEHFQAVVAYCAGTIRR